MNNSNPSDKANDFTMKIKNTKKIADKEYSMNFTLFILKSTSQNFPDSVIIYCFKMNINTKPHISKVKLK